MRAFALALQLLRSTGARSRFRFVLMALGAGIAAFALLSIAAIPEVADHQDKCPGTPAGVPVNAEGCALDDDGDGVANDKDKCPDSKAGAKVDPDGCYVMLKEQVEIRLDVEFDLNSAAAREDHKPEVEKLADFMRQHPQSAVQVEGHTDSVGSWETNYEIAYRRARSVGDLLIAEGIPESWVHIADYSEQGLAIPTADDVAEERNRRVEITVIPQN